jgi:hypothetical protein
MLVLFQIFLMIALSSSLACSKLPGARDRQEWPQCHLVILDKTTQFSLSLSERQLLVQQM